MKRSGCSSTINCKTNNRANDRRNSTDRRVGRDFLARVLAVFNLLSWGVVVLILVVAERAKPQFESFFDRWYHLDVRTGWDFEFVQYLLWITLAGTVVCSIGLVLGVFRARRKDDSTGIGLVIMGLVSLAGICGIVFFLV